MPMTIPSTDETLAAAPLFVVRGEAWADPEWIAAAAKPAEARTEAERLLWAAGPRPHPWGFVAYEDSLPDGRQAFFPSRAAYDAYMGGRAQVQAQPALDALNRGLSTQARVAHESEAQNVEVAADPVVSPPAAP
jgi:hypothetical protein